MNWLWCKIFDHCPGDIIRHRDDWFTSTCLHCGKALGNDDLGYDHELTLGLRREDTEFDKKYEEIMSGIRINGVPLR